MLVDFIINTLLRTSTAEYGVIQPIWVLEILKVFNLVKHKHKIEITVIDKLLESTFNVIYRDSSKDSTSYVEIIKEISELDYTPTTDLIEKMIHIYIDEGFRESKSTSTPFHNSLTMLKSISKLERKIGDQLLLPYIDKFEEFYEKEVEIIKNQYDLNDIYVSKYWN